LRPGSPPTLVRWPSRITISNGPGRPSRCPLTNQKSGTSMRPVVPMMRSTLSCCTEIEQLTSARMPLSNFSTAEAHSSVPASPRCATPCTVTGSRKGFPAAAPAMSRAIDIV
jgi:hypothetical protein